MVHWAPQPGFDPRRHITARQLRDLGFLLAENIPDRAFVPRLAVELDPDEDLDDGTSRLGLRLATPFSGMPIIPAFEAAYV